MQLGLVLHDSGYTTTAAFHWTADHPLHSHLLSPPFLIVAFHWTNMDNPLYLMRLEFALLV
jgi:hypothetical protein